MENKVERFDNIEGLRALSCIGIIAMHINANAHYNLGNYANNMFVFFNQLVPLFLMISGFGMCCGYYSKFKCCSSIDLNSFYTKRYKRILPFFLLLVIFDVLINHSFVSFIEGFVEATMLFGLLPNNTLEVIGVGWTIGVIFVFYMLFPFFVYLNWSRRRSILVLFSSVVISLLCSSYFFSNKFVVDGFDPRHNFLYCFPYFSCGCLVYLFRDDIKRVFINKRIVFFLICLGLSVLWFFVPNTALNIDILVVKNVVLFASWLLYSITYDSKILNNRITVFLGKISFEMYLAQMFMFRCVEKTIGLSVVNNDWIDFLIILFIEIVGLIIFVEIYKYIEAFIKLRLSKRIGC